MILPPEIPVTIYQIVEQWIFNAINQSLFEPEVKQEEGEGKVQGEEEGKKEMSKESEQKPDPIAGMTILN